LCNYERGDCGHLFDFKRLEMEKEKEKDKDKEKDKQRESIRFEE